MAYEGTDAWPSYLSAYYLSEYVLVQYFAVA